MNKMNQEYLFERLDFSNPEDMRKLVDLQNKVYEGKHFFTEDTFQYWYLDNPSGKVVSYNAIFGDVIAAHYALIPKKMMIEGRLSMGLLSMATVTHPEHRGKGLFKKLAKMSYDYAAQNGFEFVVGVANANSYPGFIKYFDFQDVGQLDVLCGFKKEIKPKGDKVFYTYWDDQLLKWRTNRYGYSKDESTIYGTKGVWKIKKVPLIKTFLGKVDESSLSKIKINKTNALIRPLNLYVGLGSNARECGYFSLPSFIKHSPFHLIFMDLTGGELPKMTKDNVFFQLMDFDVA